MPPDGSHELRGDFRDKTLKVPPLLSQLEYPKVCELVVSTILSIDDSVVGIGFISRPPLNPSSYERFRGVGSPRELRQRSLDFTYSDQKNDLEREETWGERKGGSWWRSAMS